MTVDRPIPRKPIDKSLLRTWLQNIRFEHVRAYVESGRRFADLPTNLLQDAWIRSIQQWASDVTQEPSERVGIECEFGLRGIPAPVHAVRKEWETIRNAALATWKARGRESEWQRELIADIERDLGRGDRGKDN
jgi:hypothetical protein